MELRFFTEVVSESGDCLHGETWAENADGEVGVLKWHSDGMTTFIDSVETNGRTTLLGVRLLRELRSYKREPIVPGLMNRAGERLWRLFLARYRY